MLLSQCPVNIARPVIAMKTPTTKIPKTQLGIACFIKLVFTISVFLTGHTSTQRRQLVHSSLQILPAACTLMFAGQITVNACRFLASYFKRTEPANNTKQCAVGAKESAPEILDNNG